MGFRLIPTAISGFQYVINQSGEFFYDGPVAKGNLILSVAAASGVDPAGNTFDPVLNAGVWDAVTGLIRQHFGIDRNGNLYLADSTGTTRIFGDPEKGQIDFYSAAGPGAGNLLLSLSPAGGTDYGNINTVLNGMVSYANVGGTFYAAQVTGQQVVFYTAPSEAGPWTLQTGIRFNLATGMLELGAVGAPTIEIADGNTAVAHRSSVPFDSYAGNAFNTYTPTVANDGTTTYTTRTGWWQRIGKMVLVNIYVVWGAAGSGAGAINITTPTNPARGTRQVLAGHLEGTAKDGSVELVAFTGGAGAVWDRVRNSVGVNVLGSDITNGSVLVIQGWYREA